jgi:ribosomal protein S18 acetylase RimI-like enzyme
LAIIRVPFSLLSQVNLRGVSELVSEYRQTSFTLQDGLSEWKGNGCLYIAYSNGIAGIMRLDEKRNYYDLSSFVVNSQFRGCGIGNQLLNSLPTQKPVYLKVKQENKAILLYERHHFKTIETRTGRHIMKKMELY